MSNNQIVATIQRDSCICHGGVDKNTFNKLWNKKQEVEKALESALATISSLLEINKKLISDNKNTEVACLWFESQSISFKKSSEGKDKKIVELTKQIIELRGEVSKLRSRSFLQGSDRNYNKGDE